MEKLTIFILVLSCCFQVHALSNDIQHSDGTIELILRKIADLETELSNVKEGNKDLKKEIWKLSQENKEIQLSQKNMERQLNAILNKTWTEVRTDGNVEHINVVHDKPVQIGGLPNKVNESPVIRARRLLTGSPQPTPTGNDAVGFLAYLSQHQENLGIHQTVEFKSVITNVGSAFHASTSVFTAPTDGLYFFSVSILSFQGEDIETEIVQNGNGVAYTYSGGESMFGSGSTSAVLQLSANDDVWVRILDVRSINDGNIRVFTDKWSSFCGYKIR